MSVAAWRGSSGARAAVLSKAASERLNELACADADAVLTRLESSADGLTETEAEARLHLQGLEEWASIQACFLMEGPLGNRYVDL